MASVERRVEMDVFCRCAGCHGCSGVRNPLGGTCDKAPQRYKIKGKSGKPDREGFRAYCKPCLRKQEQARAARSSATELGFVPAGSPSARASGHDHVPGNRPRIVLFGDSITEQSFGEGGFGAALANRYRRHADVLLRGYSGYNSRDAVALLKHVFPLDDPTPPVLVTVCFGANDAVKETSSMADVQGCPLPEYAEMTTSSCRVARCARPWQPAGFPIRSAIAKGFQRAEPLVGDTFLIRQLPYLAGAERGGRRPELGQ